MTRVNLTTGRRCAGLALAAALLLSAGAAPASDEAIEVVATIAPIHSLVSSVMAGVGKPTLLLPGGASPHSYALKPSDARRLAGARVIVTVGPGLETFLEKPLRHLARNARVVTLNRDAGIKLLKIADHDHGHGHDHGEHGSGTNPHVWLDPTNAVRIVDHVAWVLGEVDPANRDRYRANAAAAAERLGALDRKLGIELGPVRGAPFMVAHDAYAYFVARYDLNMVGVFHRTPEQAPGARHISALRNRMKKLGVRCVFGEPQFASRTVAASAQRAGVRAAVLDPLGLDIPPGPEAYETLMRRLSAALVGCLAVG